MRLKRLTSRVIWGSHARKIPLFLLPLQSAYDCVVLASGGDVRIAHGINEIYSISDYCASRNSPVFDPTRTSQTDTRSSYQWGVQEARNADSLATRRDT